MLSCAEADGSEFHHKWTMLLSAFSVSVNVICNRHRCKLQVSLCSQQHFTASFGAGQTEEVKCQLLSKLISVGNWSGSLTIAVSFQVWEFFWVSFFSLLTQGSVEQNIFSVNFSWLWGHKNNNSESSAAGHFWQWLGLLRESIRKEPVYFVPYGSLLISSGCDSGSSGTKDTVFIK